MPTIPNKINYDQFRQSNASSSGYDLAVEKQRIAEGTEEIKKELMEKWQQRYVNAPIFPAAISGMSAELLNFLLSFQHTLLYNTLGKKFQLSTEQRDALPQIVWHLCQNKNWDALTSLLQKNLALAPTDSDQIAQELTTQILSQAKALSAGEPAAKTTDRWQKEAAPTILQLPFSQALKEIPELGEQLLTAERIHILNFPDPVRPSLKNWLADYTSYFGYEKHSAVEIGNYLFHSANTERLSPAARQKLTYLFTAFNDNAPLNINKNLKQIVFPIMSAPTAHKTPSAPVNTPSTAPVRNSFYEEDEKPKLATSPAAAYQKPGTTTSQITPPKTHTPTSQINNPKPSTNRFSFSSPQKLPYEDAAPTRGRISFATPAAPANLPTDDRQTTVTRANTIVLQKKPTPPRPIGQNVVDLRQE
ncbi:MAG: hypothetical protein WC823_05635 [Parcubacteria group bacterium]|jgi:hypothetical protein